MKIAHILLRLPEKKGSEQSERSTEQHCFFFYQLGYLDIVFQRRLSPKALDLVEIDNWPNWLFLGFFASLGFDEVGGNWMVFGNLIQNKLMGT